jgi:acyl carrier protein
VVTDPLEEEVTRFVAEELGVRSGNLTPTTRLQHDLGVDGADGWEFMEAFGVRFGVDIGEFRAGLHFGPEAGCNPVVYLFLCLFRPQRLRFIPITVGDLVAAARSKQWTTPDRSPA